MTQLTIRCIEIFRVAVPLRGEGFRNAYAHTTEQHSIIVRVDTDGGSGYGNVDPIPGYSAASVEDTLTALHAQLGPCLLGMDARQPNAILAKLDAQSAQDFEAKAALEMACFDAVAQASALPVSALLGGRVRDTVHFNAWIGLVAPSQAAQEAKEWQARGFRSAKIKLGSGVEEDRARVMAVRAAVGDSMALRADANAAYTVDESIALGNALGPANLQLLEQPVAADDLDGLAAVRRAVPMPIMADEAVTDHASLIRVIRADCADIVKLKIMKQGGMLRTKAMIDTATAAGLPVVLGHGFGLAISTLAEVALASCSAGVMDGLEAVGPLKMAGDVCTSPPDLSTGTLQVPVGVGWGVALDHTLLSEYQVESFIIK
jgi:L-alanine-DL-glutamate epimerase-like enolase superfamily enzyme